MLGCSTIYLLWGFISRKGSAIKLQEIFFKLCKRFESNATLTSLQISQKIRKRTIGEKKFFQQSESVRTLKINDLRFHINVMYNISVALNITSFCTYKSITAEKGYGLRFLTNN